MGSSYSIIRTGWPTNVAGKEDISVAALAVLADRADRVSDDVLEGLLADLYGSTLRDWGAEADGEDYPAEDQEDIPGDADDSYYTAVGRTRLRREIKESIADLPDLARHIGLDFDGVRWWATLGENSWGNVSGDYLTLQLLDYSGVCNDPVDGDQFYDVAAVAAAVTVLDDLVDAALRTLAAAGLTPEQSARVHAQLEDERLNVLGVARTIRKAISAATPPA